MEKGKKEKCIPSKNVYFKAAAIIAFLYDACGRAEDASAITWGNIERTEHGGIAHLGCGKGTQDRNNALSMLTLDCIDRMQLTPYKDEKVFSFNSSNSLRI